MVRSIERGMETVPIIAPQQIVQRTIPTIERKGKEAIVGKPGMVDVVLSAVQIVDSAGLNWLLAVQTRLETMGIRMRLLDPSPIMAYVLLATRLYSRLKVEVTCEGHKDGSGGDHGR